jgi:hypothetical protein
VLVQLLDVTGPKYRLLNEAAVRSLLRGVSDGDVIPPVVVYRDAAASVVTLLDGFHRWRISLALGFTDIPCKLVTSEVAELVYRYPVG